MADIELDVEHQLRNTVVDTLRWDSCSVQVSGKSSSNKSAHILRDVRGVAKAGSFVYDNQSTRRL